ncbi:hypothetical protein BDN70DRAFT_809434 [Pholiota conissans]|uniref:Uncharacterized protein n=1 Tax=Pholiota conissans TaxID=109636 RepID=A0A9P6CSD6_9AGAR|nr:hypothetical protein BDN70DRAFT_809434 [Pholiota conissans]
MFGAYAQTSFPSVIVCPNTCATQIPPCAFGQILSGSKGCWKCCRVINPTCPTAACTAVPPVCPEDEIVTGTEGCWGCYILPTPQPIPGLVCPVAITNASTATLCAKEPLPCPLGEVLAGTEGCYRCCKPIRPIICPKTVSSSLIACPLVRPICLEDEVLTTSAVLPPISGILCPLGLNATNQSTAICFAEPPTCALDEVLPGVDGCWRCCRPIRPIICPQTTTSTTSDDLCFAKNPPCGPGSAAVDSHGCWKCCALTLPNCAAQVCSPTPPVCPAGSSPAGRDGCWGSCCFSV